MVENSPELDQRLTLLRDSSLQRLADNRSLDIPKVSHLGLTWIVDVTKDNVDLILCTMCHPDSWLSRSLCSTSTLTFVTTWLGHVSSLSPATCLPPGSWIFTSWLRYFVALGVLHFYINLWSSSKCQICFSTIWSFHVLIWRPMFTTGLHSFGPSYPILPLLHPTVENGPEMDQWLALLLDFRILKLTLSFHFMSINGRWDFPALPLIQQSTRVRDFGASAFGYSYMI